MVDHFRSLDLFAGAGGLSLGLEMTGKVTTLGAIENDEHAVETFQLNFPDAGMEPEDIHKLEPSAWKEIDLVCGGPPCPGFSTIGRSKIGSLVRSGKWTHVSESRHRFIDDPRNELYKQFVRFVDRLKPKAFIMENVKGMLSYRNGEIVQEIKADFRKRGYWVDAKVLNAVNFGVPQSRERIFFVGNNLGTDFQFFPDPIPTHVNPEINGDLARHSSLWEFENHVSSGELSPAVTVRNAFEDLPEIPNGGGKEVMRYPPHSNLTEYQKDMRYRLLGEAEAVYNHRSRDHTKRDLKMFQLLEPGMFYKDLPKKYHIYGDAGFLDRIKRLHPDRPSWTVVAHLYKDGYMYVHPWVDRTITVREAARLQSFPDRFKFAGARTYQFKQVGNAVPPLLARALGKAVVETWLEKA